MHTLISSSATVKWATKRATCFETLLQNELNSDVHVVPPTLKPVFQQIRLWQVAWILTTDWMKLRGIMGITSLAVKQVRVGSVKRATCTDFVAKSRTTFDFRQQFCATCDNLICCKKGLNVGGKTRKIVFQLVLLWKQVAPFCCGFIVR